MSIYSLTKKEKPSLLICGYGTGISHSVAVLFGRQGHAVYLVARNADKLNKAVRNLHTMGISAYAIVCDLSDIDSLNAMLAQMQAVKTIGLLHWNAFVDVEGKLLTTNIKVLANSLNVRVVHYLHTIQQLLPNLKHHQGAIMATSGIMAMDSDEINNFAQDFGILAVSVTAQYKANTLLAQHLQDQGVHLAQVVVAGFVHRTTGNEHRATIHPDDAAQMFWQMVQTRQSHCQYLYS